MKKIRKIEKYRVCKVMINLEAAQDWKLLLAPLFFIFSITLDWIPLATPSWG